MSVAASNSRIPLLPKVTCPTCWNECNPEDVNWIAVHEDLTEDRIAVAGEKEQLRFLPSRFNSKGFALDEKGRECTQYACPRCYNVLVRPLLQMEPLFLSILGAPGSGKSFYLAAMIRELKRTLSAKFHLRFQNAWAQGNRLITGYEQTLFGDSGDSKWVKLKKTEAQGDEWYYAARINDQDMLLPRPYLYSVQPGSRHPHYENPEGLSRVLCLYDNAGEQFLPGAVTGRAPVVDHLAKSSALLFVFDPIQDPDFRARCLTSSDDPQVSNAPFRYPQADILAEAASRIRNLTGMPESKLYDKPLVVIVNKFDAWQGILRHRPDILDSIVCKVNIPGQHPQVCLDLEKLRLVSEQMEELLLQLTPQLVNEARSFAEDVIFIPVTATGRPPKDAGSDEDGRPNLLFPQGKLKPAWVELPVLLAMHMATNNNAGRTLIPCVSRQK